MSDFFKLENGQLRLQILVQPKSAKTGWGEVSTRDESDWIQLKIAAPPVEGAANKEVIKWVAKAFKAAKSNIQIVRGMKSRYKVLQVKAFDQDRLQAFLNTHTPAQS